MAHYLLTDNNYYIIGCWDRSDATHRAASVTAAKMRTMAGCKMLLMLILCGIAQPGETQTNLSYSLSFIPQF